MNTIISKAHICGSLGRALAIIDGETWLFEGSERKRPVGNDVRFFFDFGLEIDEVTTSHLNEATLIAQLALRTRQFQCVQNMLVGMDKYHSEKVRQRSIRIAENLLAESDVLTFAEKRLLKPLERQTWDVIGALQHAEHHHLHAARRLYSIMNNSVLLEIEDLITGWTIEQGLNSLQRRVVIDDAYENGLVALVAVALFDGKRQTLKSSLFFAKGRNWNRKLATYILARLVNDKTTAKDFNKNVKEITPKEDDSDEWASISVVEKTWTILQTLLQKNKLNRKPYGRQLADPLDAVLSQVEWIANKINSGKIASAWQDVGRLIEQQLAGADPRHLAKSLTNLASMVASRPDVAITLLEMASACTSDDPTISCQMSEQLRHMGRLDEALATYDRTVKQFPHDVITQNGRAETLRAMGRLDEALAAYDRSVEQFPQEVVPRCGRAETLRTMGRLDEAFAAYNQTIEQFPHNEFARNGGAETLRTMGRLDEALAAYDRTVEQFPQAVVARCGRAETLRAMGRLDEALAAYDRTIEQFPQVVVARNGRAETLRAMGHLDEALFAHEQTVEQFPRDVFARNGRAETLRVMGRLDEALAAYDRTVELFPQDVVARSGRAETLRAMGRPEEALAAYDRTVEQFPHNEVAQTGRAVVLCELGQYDDALKILEVPAARLQGLQDWIAAHVYHTIEIQRGASATIVDRLKSLADRCPFPVRRPYFMTSLAIAQIALKRIGEAQASLDDLISRKEFDVQERSALQLMRAHAQALNADVGAAQQSIDIAKIISHEEIKISQIRNELEKRIRLMSEHDLIRDRKIDASDKRLIRLELDFWVNRAIANDNYLRLAA